MQQVILTDYSKTFVHTTFTSTFTNRVVGVWTVEQCTE